MTRFVPLLMTLLWLGLAVYAFFIPGGESVGPVAGSLAVVFALFNVVRYYARARPARMPRPPRKRDVEPYNGPNPDFNFNLRTPEMGSED